MDQYNHKNWEFQMQCEWILPYTVCEILGTALAWSALIVVFLIVAAIGTGAIAIIIKFIKL